MNNSSAIIAGSILIAGAIVAGAIIYSNGLQGASRTGGGTAAVGDAAPGGGGAIQEASGAVSNLKPITKDDHIRGNIDAPIKIVEFSDTECPFCKMFHSTMQQAFAEYKGQVAWVYRHFPLDSIHSKARKEAEATECAADLGGNDKFWAYLDKIFEITPANNGLDSSELPKIAEQIGLNRQKFEQCLASGKFAKNVQEDLDDATSSGGLGTPYSIAISTNGKKFVISGAQPYEAVKQAIDAALNEK